MPPHNCIQDERIRELTARVDKLEEKILNIVETLKDFKDFQKWLIRGMISASLFSCSTLILLIFKLKGVG